MNQLSKIDDIDDIELFDSSEEESELVDEVLSFAGSDRFQDYSRERIIQICIVVSLLVHVGLMAGLPRLFGIIPSHDLLKPGEKVTNVRLIEQPSLDQKPDVPPSETNAISDRNNVAEKERIPKTIPMPETPLGQPEPIDKKMASLVPPAAPEDFSSPKEPEPQDEKPRKEEGPRPSQHPKVQKPNKTKTKEDTKNEYRPTKKESKHHKVDLRPNAQEMATGIAAQGGLPDFHPEGDVEEAVVDINTREDRFFSYLLHLKRKIQGVWIYPSVASRAGIGGSLTVEFSIDKTGELLYVNLIDSSGYNVLDESAMKAIRSAAPYFPFPARMKAKKLRVKANFIYVTQNFFRNIM